MTLEANIVKMLLNFSRKALKQCATINQYLKLKKKMLIRTFYMRNHELMSASGTLIKHFKLRKYFKKKSQIVQYNEYPNFYKRFTFLRSIKSAQRHSCKK